MGIKERRQRQFEQREQRFLEAARELIREDGLLKLQMSRIAERAEYAVGTLYLHFASKEDLLLALTIEQAKEHVELFLRVARWDASPRERMFAIGVADMLFVRRNPNHFRIGQYVFTEVVWGAASPERRAELLEANDPISAVVTGFINEAVGNGELELRGLSPEQMSVGLWALTIGTHNLVHAEGVMADLEVANPYRLYCRHLQTLLNGYGWKPLADVADESALDALIERISREVFPELCGDCRR
ncbi:MAG: TetR/AcrR family transcriptional regulator [Stagnimonas sp.]|nr:TetR/AcrR family transcriptional regulator [Stagnimonas sp.]